MTHDIKSFDVAIHPPRHIAPAIGLGLAVAGVGLWFGWAARERALLARTRDRLR